MGRSATNERQRSLLRYLDFFCAQRGQHNYFHSSSSQLANDVSIAAFRIQAWVEPPTQLRAATEVEVRIHGGGERALLFELSRYLKVDAVEADGRPVDFLQNPAIEAHRGGGGGERPGAGVGGGGGPRRC